MMFKVRKGTDIWGTKVFECWRDPTKVSPVQSVKSTYPGRGQVGKVLREGE